MDFLKSVHEAVQEVISEDDAPVVVFSSAWPFLKEMGERNVAAANRLLDILLEATGNRGILVPTFTGGFNDGLCNLDIEPSTTGMLSELFRNRPGVRRTLSAFFSFAVAGDAEKEVINLKPQYVWGDGSLYGWMEERNVRFLMFGVHPTHCSYLHRLEWLAREAIDYRYVKEFRGQLIREGISLDMLETLYVRRLDPPVINDFTVLLPALEQAGMKTVVTKGIRISSYSAKMALKALLPLIKTDPLIIVENRMDYEGNI